MIDERTLAYTFDEEAHGFGEPPRAEAPPLSWAQKGALALVALGVLSLAVQSFGGPYAGTWLGLLSSFGAMSLGGALTFWLGLKDSRPGIKHDGNTFKGLLARGPLAWIAGVLMTGFYGLLYWFPHTLGYVPEMWRDGVLVEPARVTGGLVATVAPLAQLMTGGPPTQWFLYGFIYTLAILVFGVRTAMKYRHNRYQLVRTGSVMAFQLVLAFALPNVLRLFQQPEFYFSYFWPLKPYYLYPDGVHGLIESGRLGVFMVIWATAMIAIATPILTYFYGKRWYCSWVCGCGGLAETLGDPWRQLSDKSTRAWKIERWMVHGVLVAITVSTAVLWINSWRQGQWLGEWSNPFAKAYGFWIGAIFSGVVGVGFYPLLGSRVWCRFGCPMAAILGIFQRFFSRFRITTNGGQCMSCGNCSTYCEMGIDVRSYAQKGENIVRASCVGCGVCAAVCPRGVLDLENGASHADRYPGSDMPFDAFLKSLGVRERPR